MFDPPNPELTSDPLVGTEGRSTGRSKYSRSGVRRAGDDYQDIVALSLLVEMLEHPNRYEWVQVEADDVGALDDVFAKRTDGTIAARQVKFSAYPEDPDDPYNWKKLIETSEGRHGPTKSLLAKWAEGLKKALSFSPTVDAFVFSNRRAAEDLQAALSPDGRVDLGRVTDPLVRSEIIAQVGGEQEATLFFSVFRFKLDHPELDTIEEIARHRFLTLGGTEAGWDRLCSELRKWVRHRELPAPDGKIRLAAVKAACRWHFPEALPQDFAVPDDFVVPSQSFHDRLIASLQSQQEGWIVIVGAPGTGKSTYVSFLFRELRSMKVPVIRHHYYLSLDDTTPDRYNHLRVADSLMAEIIAEVPDLRESLESRNPQPQQLGQWLTVVADHLHANSRSLVVILDGLDHVWRDQGAVSELNRLFNMVTNRAGLRVVVGTQPVDESQLPQKLLQIAPRQGWWRLPMLDDRALQSWILKHGTDPPEPDDHAGQYRIQKTVGALMEKSEGYPLYLQFLVRSLAEQGKALTADNVRDAPACPHQDINRYYAQLWTSLPDDSRQIIHLLAACTFPWPREGILGCLDPTGEHLPRLQAALRQVSHLAPDSGLGLRPLHASLLVFVRDLPEHAEYAGFLKVKALTWLQTRAPDLWRWSYTWLTEAEMGNDATLADGPDRAWLVEAVANRRPTETVNKILTTAAEIALQNKRLGRFVQLGLLADYYNTAIDFRQEVIDAMAYAQLRSSQSPDLLKRLALDLANQSDGILFAIAEQEAERGNDALVETVLDELDERRSRPLTDHSELQNSLGQSKYLVRVAALSGNLVPENIASLIGRIKRRDSRLQLLDVYAETLRSHRRSDYAIRLLSRTRRWPMEPRAVVLRHIIPLSCEEGFELSGDLVAESDHRCSVMAVLLALHHRGSSTGKLRLLDPWILKLKDYQQYEVHEKIRSFFHELFFALLANEIQGHPQENETYLQHLPTDRWTSSFLKVLAEEARAVAARLAAREAVAYSSIYETLFSLDPPAFGDQRDDYRLGIAAGDALFAISRDLRSLSSVHTTSSPVSQRDLERVCAAPLCNVDSWIRLYVEARCQWLSDEAAHWLVGHQKDLLLKRRDVFSVRAQMYADLGNLAALHKMIDSASELVHLTSENLISYGDRKDSLLHEAIDAAHCAAAADHSAKAKDWLRRLAPAVESVAEYTDGKGTSQLPQTLGNVLAQHFPDWFQSYYVWLVNEEEYRHALHVFQSFIRYADLNDELNRAVAKTGADDRALYTLNLRAEQGDAWAEECLRSLALFTPPDEDPDGLRSSSVPEEESPVPVTPESYRPDQFSQFIELVGQSGIWSTEKHVTKWAEHWAAEGKSVEVLAVLDQRVMLRKQASGSTMT